MTRAFVDYPWRIVITTLDSVVITFLDTRSTDRQFLFTLNGPAYHTGQVAGDDIEINRPYPNDGDPALLTNNRRLVYGLRRELHADPPYVCRFGGIVTTLEDQGADAPTTRYTAYDPWQYVYSRPARDPDTGALLGEKGYTYPEGARASTIAFDALLMSDIWDGETYIDFTTDPGLIEDTTPLDEPFTIEQAQSVGEVWDALVDTGTIDIELRALYDPARPGKVCDFRTTPFAGTTRFNTVMGWDVGNQSLIAATRTVDRMANKVRFYSGAAAGAVTQTDAVSVAANGAWWTQQAYGGARHQALANLLALAELNMRRNGERVLTFTPITDRIGYSPLQDYALGDYVPVWASQNFREPLGIDYAAYATSLDPGEAGYQRIYGIPISVDDNGVETVPGLITSQDSPIG